MQTLPVTSPSKLKTLEEIDQALYELSWIDHQQRIIDAQNQQEIDALKKSQASRFDLLVEGVPTTLAERRQTVSAAIQVWSGKHLDEHLVEPKRSLDLPHGTVGKRSLPLAIECSEGVKPRDVIDKLDHKTGFRQAITDLAMKVIGRCTLGMFVEFKPQLSMISLRNAYKAKRVTDRALNSLGLQVRKESDEMFHEPARYETDPNSPS